MIELDYWPECPIHDRLMTYFSDQGWFCSECDHGKV